MQRMGKEAQDPEAMAMLASASQKLALGMSEEALVLARAAQQLLSGSVGEAKASRIAIRALLADERLGEAARLLREHPWCDGRTAETAALCEADVLLATGRPRQALRSAGRARELCEQLQDDEGLAEALDLEVRAGLRLDGVAGTGKALAAAEAALALRRRLGDGQEDEALLALSRVHLARHEYEDAFAFAGAAVEAARSSGNERGEAGALRELSGVVRALAEIGQEDADTAVHYAKDAAELFRSLGDAPGEVAARHALAQAFVGDGMSSLALEALQGAMSMARELGNRPLIKAGFDLLAKLHAPAKAAAALEKQAALARSVGHTWLELETLHRAARLHSSVGMHNVAKRTAATALEVARTAGDAHREARVHRCMADMHEVAKEHTEALRELAKARALFTTLGDVCGAAEASKVACVFCEDSGNLRGALDACKQQVETYRAAGWREQEAEATIAMAEVAARATNPAQALQIAREALQMCKEIDHKDGEADAWLCIAVLQFEHSFNFKESLNAAEKAQALFQGVGNPSGEANALKIAGSALLAQGAGERAALGKCRKALEICQRHGDHKGEAFVLQALVDMHMGIVREHTHSGMPPPPEILEDALNLALLAASAWESLRDSSSQAWALLQLSGLYLMDDDGDAALQAAKESREIAEKFDDIGPEAAAQLAMADAHMHRESWKDAQEAAEDAKALYGDLEDSFGKEDAEDIMRRAKMQLSRKWKKKPPESKPKPPRARAERGMWTSVVESLNKASADAHASSRRRREALLTTTRRSTLGSSRGGAAAEAPSASEAEAEDVLAARLEDGVSEGSHERFVAAGRPREAARAEAHDEDEPWQLDVEGEKLDAALVKGLRVKFGADPEPIHAISPSAKAPVQFFDLADDDDDSMDSDCESHRSDEYLWSR